MQLLIDRFTSTKESAQEKITHTLKKNYYIILIVKKKNCETEAKSTKEKKRYASNGSFNMAITV